MNQEQAKNVAKAVSRTDAVKMVLSDMRQEIADKIVKVSEQLGEAESVFVQHAQNAALVRHSDSLDIICAASGIERRSVFAVVNYDFNAEPDAVRVILTDGSAYDHRLRLVVDMPRPDLTYVRELRQELLRLREMQDPDAEEARANVLKDAMEHTEEGKRVLEALKDLRAACKS
jgi:hypothetical protein